MRIENKREEKKFRERKKDVKKKLKTLERKERKENDDSKIAQQKEKVNDVKK